LRQTRLIKPYLEADDDIIFALSVQYYPPIAVRSVSLSGSFANPNEFETRDIPLSQSARRFN
jgi:hypothetical protein